MEHAWNSDVHSVLEDHLTDPAALSPSRFRWLLRTMSGVLATVALFAPSAVAQLQFDELLQHPPAERDVAGVFVARQDRSQDAFAGRDAVARLDQCHEVRRMTYGKTVYCNTPGRLGDYPMSDARRRAAFA